MIDIIYQLQTEVYKIDRVIGSLADDLRNKSMAAYEIDKDRLDYYNNVGKRLVILECMEKLKAIL